MDAAPSASADAPSPESPGETRIRWRAIIPVLVLLLFGGALWALHNQLTQFHWSEMWGYTKSLPFSHIMLAIFATLGSYLAVIGYNLVALRYAHQKVPLKVVAFNSFVINAFSLNMGAAILSSNAVRLRLYGRHGFTGGEMVKVVIACGLFTLLGQAILCGVYLSTHPLPVPAQMPVPIRIGQPVGVVLTIVAAFALGALIFRIRPVVTRNWRVPLVPWKLLRNGIIWSIADWTCAALVILALLPSVPGWTLAQVFSVILLAQLAGTLTSVPGGLGVVEFVIIGMLPDTVSDSEVLGALLAYRLIYLLGPFLIAVGMFVSTEIHAQRETLVAKAEPWLELWRKIAPNVLALLVFLSGVLLLVSGSTPGLPTRMDWLAHFVPLVLVEASHFLASAIGLFLLVLAWSLRRRVNAAWITTVILLSLSILLSLLKGLDWEEALLLGAVLAVLVSIRREFYRHATLFAERFSIRWWFLTVLVLVGAAWIGFLAYRHVDYADELWWRFTYAGHAPRFLRALAGTSILLMALALAQMLRTSTLAGEREVKMPGDIEQKIIANSTDCEACLAWLGDKRFLVNEAGTAFLMYGTFGRSRVQLGDPIGPEEEWEGLLWQFREECTERGMRPVVYGLSEEHAHHYLDVGLQLFKAGEEARIHLPKFELSGGSRKELRKTIARFEDRGFVFEIHPKEKFEEFAPELREVSDGWLQDKNAKEKSFSLGSFREDFLCHFPFATITQEGKIVAFANLFASGKGTYEFSIDLMRFHPELSPNGTMQYLFVKLMLWGQQQGYEWFSLGVAPLSGLQNRPMSPLWHKVGATIFRHAEHFYNFQGLRAYKDKFKPKWVSAYIAVPNIMDLPPALMDTSALVSGGVLGMVRK